MTPLNPYKYRTDSPAIPHRFTNSSSYPLSSHLHLQQQIHEGSPIPYLLCESEIRTEVSRNGTILLPERSPYYIGSCGLRRRHGGGAVLVFPKVAIWAAGTQVNRSSRLSAVGLNGGGWTTTQFMGHGRSPSDPSQTTSMGVQHPDRKWTSPSRCGIH